MKATVRVIGVAIAVLMLALGTPSVFATGSNDLYTGATPIGPNQSGTGNVQTSTDRIDWWVVELPSPGEISVSLTVDQNDDDIDLFLYDKNLVRLDFSNLGGSASEHVEASISYAGKVYFEVEAWSTPDGSGPYHVSVSFQGQVTTYSLTVEARVDAGWIFQSVNSTVAGSTKSTTATYNLQAGTYTLTVPSFHNGRAFSHFWDQTKNADVNYNGSTSYTFSMSSNHSIIVLYKEKTKIVDLAYGSGTISGKLLENDGDLLKTTGNSTVYGSNGLIVNRSVHLNYYDGTWRNIAAVIASSANGVFSRSWTPPVGATKIRAVYHAHFDINDGNAGDGVFYMPAPTVERQLPLGDLGIAVYNTDGTKVSDMGDPGIAATTVNLWKQAADGSYGPYAGVRTTDSFGVVFFNGIEPGLYIAEVRHQPGLQLNVNEYWGSSAGILVVANSSNPYSFVRHTQTFDDFPVASGIKD